MKKYKVLVFPCGSECGLEIGRSLRSLKEIELWGGSSVDDHGEFFFENYIGDIPFVDDPAFVDKINESVDKYGFDMIYPAMDSVLLRFAERSNELRAQAVGSCRETILIAAAKSRTYEVLRESVRCPRQYELEQLESMDFPVFLKPDVGYGSRGVVLAANITQVSQALRNNADLLILENLPGSEYTVDCFTDFRGNLLYVAPRIRARIARGISVGTVSVDAGSEEFVSIASRINEALSLNGAWFFQLKRDVNDELSLLEIAPRIAGSMGLQRCRGVNLPLLSVFNQAKVPVTILQNSYGLRIDRALGQRVRISKQFGTLYLDFDDCLLLEGRFLNPEIIKLVAQCRNSEIPVVLISRHSGDLIGRLKELGLVDWFADIHHLVNNEPKTRFMSDRSGILIDDSFSERKEAADFGISSLGPESADALFTN